MMVNKLNITYLDNAATTWPKPQSVLERMTTIFNEIGVSPGRGGYDAAVTASQFIDDTRNKVARFFNAPDARRVIFTANATDGLNMALAGVLKPGDHVVTTRLEHNSVLRPLHYLQKNNIITCTHVPFDGRGVVHPDDIRRAFTPRTRLVVMTHASNVLGTIQPVEEVGKICQNHGIGFLVDASQSAGQIPVDMGEIGASALVFTGHKSLYGPPGIGGLIIDPDFDIQATRFGGTGIHSASLDQPEEFPHRLEAGTHNLLGIIGLSLCLDFITKKEITTIHHQGIAHLEQLIRELSTIKKITLYGSADISPDQRLAVLTVNLADMDPADLGAILDGDFDIAVRTGLHCAPLAHDTLGTGKRGAVRFSMGMYNTPEDIDYAVRSMAQITRL